MSYLFARARRFTRPVRLAGMLALAVALALPAVFGLAHTAPGAHIVHAAPASAATATASGDYGSKPTVKLNQDCDFQNTALTIKVSGSQFQPGETVVITFDTTTIATTTANFNGLFTKVPAPLPSNPATGTHTITATGQSSGDTASHVFDTQAGSYPAPSNNGAKILLVPYCQYAPSSGGGLWFNTHISGSGFTPGEGVEIYFDSIAITSVAANSKGHISDGVGELVSPGTHWFEAVGDASGRSSSAAMVVIAES